MASQPAALHAARRNPPSGVAGVGDAAEEIAGLDHVQGDVAGLARELVQNDELVDFVEIGSGAISEYMVNKTTPFYVRIHSG